MGDFLQLFVTGLGIFIGVVLCLYVCNGFKITSPHNRRKRERQVRRERIFVISRQVNSENPVDATPTNTNPTIVVHSPPPDYSTINQNAMQDIHAARTPLDVCPPPSYNEAVRADRSGESRS